MKSIIHSLGSDEFPRIRLGIGSPDRREMIDHVLSKFKRAEIPIVRDTIQSAADAVEMYLAEGPEPTMNRFNAVNGVVE
jgi:PTH1 family peptidyl-tRNA hydrolase